MSKSTRQAFGESLLRLGAEHPEVVVLDADLSKSTKTDLFAKKFPERFFEMGIAEANMIGTAAGLALSGKIPFACSFGCFLTGRYDTIRMSVVYSDAPVRLVGTHAGVGIGDDGHSQMGLEDVALMRALPNMGIFQPMDARETELLMEFLVREWKGPAYLRLTRQNLPDLYPAGMTFQPGRLLQIVGPDLQASPDQAATYVDVALVATGAAVAEAVQAAAALSQKGLKVSVWNAHSLKPFDHERTREIAAASRLLVSVEDHSVIGGLGSCISDVLSSIPRHSPLLKLGIQDAFGESGDPAELYDLHGISAKAIAQTVGRRVKELEK